MAETVELCRGARRRSGAIGGLFAAFRAGLSRLVSARRGARLRPEEWPDYLLRDIGLSRAARDTADPREVPTDWLHR